MLGRQGVGRTRVEMSTHSKKTRKEEDSSKVEQRGWTTSQDNFCGRYAVLERKLSPEVGLAHHSRWCRTQCLRGSLPEKHDVSQTATAITWLELNAQRLHQEEAPRSNPLVSFLACTPDAEVKSLPLFSTILGTTPKW